MGEKMSLRLGNKVPDFTLKDQHNNELKLSRLRGKKVLLSFHPLAWTKVCAQQMQSLEANKERFEELNTVPLGISVDSGPSKHAWTKALGIKNTRLLSNFWPHGGIARLLGVFREDDGFSERVNVVLDKEGKIVLFKKYDIPELPGIQEIIDFLES